MERFFFFQTKEPIFQRVKKLSPEYVFVFGGKVLAEEMFLSAALILQNYCLSRKCNTIHIIVFS